MFVNRIAYRIRRRSASTYRPITAGTTSSVSNSRGRSKLTGAPFADERGKWQTGKPDARRRVRAADRWRGSGGSAQRSSAQRTSGGGLGEPGGSRSAKQGPSAKPGGSRSAKQGPSAK